MFSRVTLNQSDLKREVNVCAYSVLCSFEWCFCEARWARQGEDPRRLLARKREGQVVKSFVSQRWKLAAFRPTVSGNSTDGEDGAAPRPCHVSVYWTNISH